MKDTPILFTPENAQKVHEGTKTQTRRAIKGAALDIINDLAGDPDPFPLKFEYVKDCKRFQDDGDADSEPYLYTGLLVSLAEYPEEGFMELPCPYGHCGDRLWVREGLEKDGQYIRYRHGLPQRVINKDRVYPLWQWKKDTLSGRFMPKWACRTWLELTGVRVERLRDITAGDCIREGIPEPRRSGAELMMVDDGFDAIWTFRSLWRSINGPGSWDFNPWVWVLEYKRIELTP